MKKLSLALSLAFGATALADVPALINYQGRLVDGVGNPIVGKKEFKLDIYDSQTDGTLIYQETLADIELDEDGAYSFQFGAGESRSETSVLVATGDGEAAFFQKVFEETPVGVISVTDGTNTFKTGDAPTGEEPFSFTYTTSLKRLNLVCNEPPAEGTKFTATFRYAESGIVGALGSAAEHWMEVTIGGEKQEPRQRLVAVPFALKSAVANSLESDSVIRNTILNWTSGGTNRSGYQIPETAREIEKIEYWKAFSWRGLNSRVYLEIRRLDKDSDALAKFPSSMFEDGSYESVLSTDVIGEGSEKLIRSFESGNRDLFLARETDFDGLIFDHQKYLYWILIRSKNGINDIDWFYDTADRVRLFYTQ
ncbi:hypothetical protein N9128_06055 [Akkermansiaceae bacterium]|nr:hypothetical protein [Akkermansiaceae bacterium]